ncbi:hypothetical protein [Streptomyces sp. DH12]|uniref:hypothetical protein n=1 Tax=Streptomyces sp. DH12 TaxID=2857010 RepID=UPI001E3C1C6E|nr:hypothetical protein [Streptomyces sp. DH12]
MSLPTLVLSQRMARALAVTAGSAALVAAGAAPASATTVIGFGNAAISNACTNIGAPIASGATASGPGAVNALLAAAPIGSPANQCGNLGLPSVLREDLGVDVVSTLDGGEG